MDTPGTQTTQHTQSNSIVGDRADPSLILRDLSPPQREAVKLLVTQSFIDAQSPRNGSVAPSAYIKEHLGFLLREQPEGGAGRSDSGRAEHTYSSDRQT